MDNVLSTKAEPKTEAEYEAAIDSLLQELPRIDKRIAQDRREIENLKAETRVIASHTESKLTSIKQQLDLMQKVG